MRVEPFRSSAAGRNRRRAHLALLALLTPLVVITLPVSPAVAAGAAPTVALVGPADAASGIASPTSLQVRLRRNDDVQLEVTFHAQARVAGAPNPSAPFTFALIPDTQNYVSTGGLAPTMGVQTQWIADHRTDLNLAFVTHLGDIVGLQDSAVQWQRASQYMATLDTAGVPNTVLPGNHDMNLTTGEAALYKQYFPPSRYSAAAWNSPTATLRRLPRAEPVRPGPHRPPEHGQLRTVQCRRDGFPADQHRVQRARLRRRLG